jgi:hypothetical protein
MSALPPKADIDPQSANVRFVPKADIDAQTDCHDFRAITFHRRNATSGPSAPDLTTLLGTATFSTATEGRSTAAALP